jgi:hypothetical protein
MPIKIFATKDSNLVSTIKRNTSRTDLKAPKMTLNTSYSTKTFRLPKQETTIHNTQAKIKVVCKLKRINKSTKPVMEIHERSKSSMKTPEIAIAKASEGFKRSLINFKTDLMSLNHDNRYSKENEALIKLVQKYTDKLVKIEQWFGKIKHWKPIVRAKWETARQSTNNDFTENGNYIDIASSKDRKYKELEKKNKYLLEKNEKLQKELKTLKRDSIEMGRKLEINNKHEEIETIFSKLGSLMLANKMEDNLNLRQHERKLIKELFGSKHPI